MLGYVRIEFKEFYYEWGVWENCGGLGFCSGVGGGVMLKIRLICGYSVYWVLGFLFNRGDYCL